MDYRRLARAGGDPATARPTPKPTTKPSKTRAPTFKKVAAEVIDFHRPTWRNPRSAAQWESSLRDYAYPVLGNKPVDEITSAHVLRVLQPIWNTKRETARRTRQRISAVMKAAIAAGYRRDNPAADALTSALPRGGGARRNQRALPYAQVADALARVRASMAHATTKLALEFLSLDGRARARSA